MLEVRGGKPVKLMVKGEAVLPAVDIQQKALDFGEVYTGVTARIPITIINTTPVLAGQISLATGCLCSVTAAKLLFMTHIVTQPCDICCGTHCVSALFYTLWQTLQLGPVAHCLSCFDLAFALCSPPICECCCQEGM